MSSKRRHDRTQPPPVNRVPRNLNEPAYEIEEINIGSWCPLSDGQGPATQVHLAIQIRGLPLLIMRFKEPGSLDQLIASLERHRADVWPYKD